MWEKEEQGREAPAAVQNADEQCNCAEADQGGGAPPPNENDAVRTRLLAAGPAAVEFLVGALFNEQLSYRERIDIAKDLLNRGFGKTLPALPQQEEADAVADTGWRIELGEEAQAYAQ